MNKIKFAIYTDLLWGRAARHKRAASMFGIKSNGTTLIHIHPASHDFIHETEAERWYFMWADI